MTFIIFLSTIFKTICKKLSPKKIKYVGFKKCSAFSLKDSLQNSIFIQQGNIGSIKATITKNLNKDLRHELLEEIITRIIAPKEDNYGQIYSKNQT